MKMFENRSFAFLALLLFVFICGTLSCDCGDDDDDDSDGSDDDDDVEPIYNRADHPFETPRYPPDPGTEINGVYFQQIAGGEPGESGTSTVVGPDDTVYVAAEKGGLIYLYSFTPGADDWTREPVAYFATSPSLGIDSEGHLHLAYTDQYEFREKTEYFWNYKLVYATNKSGTWQHEMVDSEGDVGYDPCLVVDANDDVHISYLDAGNEALKYATNRTGAWVIEAATPSGDTFGYGRESSLAIDDEGYAHISFTNNEYGGGVYYATNIDGDWTYLTLGLGYRSSIVMDHEGAVHIFFEKFFGLDSEISQLGYATDKSGSWSGGVLDSTLYSGYYPSATLREDGAVQVVYQSYNEADYYLHYGVVSSGTWESQTTFGDSTYNEELSVSADSQGLFYVAYHVNNNLRATTFDPQTSEHLMEELDGDYMIYSHGTHDLAIDSDGRPHVSFLDSVDYNLMYAQSIGETWQIQRVDSSDYCGSYNAIATDKDGGAHIAYANFVLNSGYENDDENFLRYATNKSGHWEIQELADNFSTYKMTIYLDDDGFVHIGYTGGSIDYITNQSGEWLYTDMGSGFNVGSLFMDDERRVHFSYERGCGVSYGILSGETWNQQWCVENGDFTEGNSMVMDSSGYIHVVYCVEGEEVNSHDLYYITNQSGGWESTLLWDTCDNLKIHVDQQDNLHVINSSVYLTNASGEWRQEIVLPNLSLGSGLDKEGYVHAAFYDNQGLWYAKFPQGIEN